VKQVSLYGILILIGVAALFGAGVATFGLGDTLASQTAAPAGLPDLEPIGGEMKAFQLVVKEPEVKFVCRPELMNEGEQPLPDFELILVNDLPDQHAPELVSFSGCPLTDRCVNRAAETY
jgi:hypothetical protein